METIKSVLGYGSVESQSGEEPLSGQTGAGTAAEPYDGGNATGQSGSGAAGNVEEPFAGIKSGSEQKPISTETGAHSAVEPADVVNDAGRSDASVKSPQAGSADEATSETMNKIKNETLPSKPSSNMYLTNFPGLQGHPIPNSEPTPTSSVYPQHTISSLAPLTNTDDTSSHKPASEDQGANRLLDEPTGKRTTEAIRDQKLKTEDAQATGAPVDTLHKEAITQPGNQVGKPFGTNLEGTNSGEEYLRSTSLTAEGDNLDATKPGDGQKADRLHGGSGTPANTSDASPEADLVDSTKKMKLTDKIKGKLHIGKKSSSG